MAWLSPAWAGDGAVENAGVEDDLEAVVRDRLGLVGPGGGNRLEERPMGPAALRRRLGSRGA